MTRRRAARRLLRLGLGLALLHGLAPQLHAQGLLKVKVRVTGVSGGGVFLDQGREAGLRAGDTVRLFPARRTPVLGRLRSVSRTSARADFATSALVGVEPGTDGEVEVPRGRQQQTETPEPERPAVVERELPEHPPWTDPLGERDPNQPLLAPPKGREPEDRPTRLSGRLWSNVTNTWQRGRFDNRYLLANVGTNVRLTNPLKLGGELEFQGDLSYRGTDLDNATGQYTTRARLDRLSYRYGHADDGPYRFQLGRFLQTMFPEFGLVDGAEVDAALNEHHRVGASVGAFPEPFINQNSGDDVQTAMFWRGTTGEERELEAGFGYQKSWYKGAQDRDLLVFNVFSQPVDELSLYSALWLDYYTSSDDIKSSGFQVTEYQFNGTYTPSVSHGFGLNINYFRWPELKRDEFRNVNAEQIRDDYVFRLDANSWHELGDHLHLDGRVGYWNDDETSGYNFAAGVGLRNLLYENGYVYVNVFRNENAFDDGFGARLTADWYTGSLTINGSYELSRYDYETLTSGTNTLQALTGGLQWIVSQNTDLSLTLDYRFGDTQDALTGGAFVQTRF